MTVLSGLKRRTGKDNAIRLAKDYKWPEHNDIRWITPGEISRYKFCPADEEIIKRLIKNAPAVKDMFEGLKQDG